MASSTMTRRAPQAARGALQVPVPPSPEPGTEQKDGGRSLLTFLTVLWVLAAGAGLFYGWDYYRLPLTERPFAAKHDLLAPSSLIGHSLGIAGSLMMFVGVGMYSLRKRVAFLRSAGRLSYWLQVHIFLCTLGPFLVLLHTSFRFGGIVSIAFWSMMAVVLSGLFGRYLYVRIPKSIHGQFTTLESIERRRDDLIDSIGRTTGVAPETVALVLGRRTLRSRPGLLRAMADALKFDLGRRARTARLTRLLDGWKVPPGMRGSLLQTLERQARVEHQILVMQPFQRLFRYWHVFHLPLAVLMFLILIVHVTVAAMFGYGWPG